MTAVGGQVLPDGGDVEQYHIGDDLMWTPRFATYWGRKDCDCCDELCKKCIHRYISLYSKCGPNSAAIRWPYMEKPDTIIKQEIPYDNTRTMKQIPKIISKISQEKKRLEEIIRHIEIRLIYIIKIHEYFWENDEDDYVVQCCSKCEEIDILDLIEPEKEKTLAIYNRVIDYYLDIPNLMEQYQRLLEAHKSRNTCVECFAKAGDVTDYKDYGTITLKRKGDRMRCNVCLDKNKEGHRPQRCCVCLADYPKSQMKAAACGDIRRTESGKDEPDHLFCKTCYSAMKHNIDGFGNPISCPVCRGSL
jgi:hypothetical protein